MPEPSGTYIVRRDGSRWTLYHLPKGYSAPTRVSAYPSKRDAVTVAHLLAGCSATVIVD